MFQHTYIPRAARRGGDVPRPSRRRPTPRPLAPSSPGSATTPTRVRARRRAGRSPGRSARPREGARSTRWTTAASATVTIAKAITIDVTGVTGGVSNVGPQRCDRQRRRQRRRRPARARHQRQQRQRGADPAMPVHRRRAACASCERSRCASRTRGSGASRTPSMSPPRRRSTCSSTASTSARAAPMASSPRPPPEASVNVAIQDSTISNSNTALSVADNTTAWLTRTTIFGNALGLRGARHRRDQRLGRQPPDGQHRRRRSDQPAQSGSTPPSAGPTGPAGAAGADRCAAGPQGPQGEPRAQAAARRRPAQARAARRGKQVALSYAATAAAKSTLTITEGPEERSRPSRGSSKAGANTIRLERQGRSQGRGGRRVQAHAARGRQRRAAGRRSRSA